MTADHVRRREHASYRSLDTLVVRGSAHVAGCGVSWWPDLTGSGASIESWRAWLEEACRVAGFASALELASPALDARVSEICAKRPVSQADARRAVLAVMRYLLRFTSRATPYGLFAGVAVARVGESVRARIGRDHRPHMRVEATWLSAVVTRLEAMPALWPGLTVVANNLAVDRGDEYVLDHRPAPGRGAPQTVIVRASAPLRKALDYARTPLGLRKLAEKLVSDFPGVPYEKAQALLGRLVEQQLLLTNLRPPMTAADPLVYVINGLREAGGQRVPEAADVLTTLDEIAEHTAHHTAAGGSDSRRRARHTMASLNAPDAALTVDLRLDWDLTIPSRLTNEAAAAADVLVRLAPRPDRGAGWAAWHRRFLDRYGIRTLVPIRDALDADSGLGYPAGFLGAPPPPVVAFTDRDAKLLTLAQTAVLRRHQSINLTDAMIADLQQIEPGTPVQPATALPVRVHAANPRDVEAGNFTLSIVSASRGLATSIGRILYLLDPDDRARISHLCMAAPTTTAGAITAHLTCPPLHQYTENVARAPQLPGALLPLGEYHEAGPADVVIDDLAISADQHRLYINSLSRKVQVEPLLLNAVEPARHVQPLVRFLAEAPTALSCVPCDVFDWGAAANTLPFLPELRYRHAILAPARWLLRPGELPGGDATWPEWDEAFAAWKACVDLPASVYLGTGDRRFRVDLTIPAHRELVRAQLERAGTTMMRAAPDESLTGWLAGHVHELTIPLTATAEPAPAPKWQCKSQAYAHTPGTDGRIFVKLYAGPARQTRILLRHLPTLIDELGDSTAFWFQRYHDPDEHLRLRFLFPEGSIWTSRRVAAWCDMLVQRNLISHATWDTDRPEAGRFGGETLLPVVEAYFAADSAAALAQLSASPNESDRTALTAASLMEITIGLIGAIDQGAAWLIDHAPRASSAPPRLLYQRALALANPDDRAAIVTLPTGPYVLDAWAKRRAALQEYRTVLQRAGTMPATAVLPDLFHLHHARIRGTGLAAETECLHLARAAALSWNARNRRRS